MFNTKKKRKSIISLVLSIVLTLSLIPLSSRPAYAAQQELSRWSFVQGSTSTTATLPQFSTGIFQGSSFSHYSATSVGYTASSKSIYTGNWENALTTPKYWQINTSSKGYTNLSVQFNAWGSSTAPRDFVLEYSTDGSNFIKAADYVLTATAQTFTIPLPTGAANADNLLLRFRASSTTSISGSTVASGGNSRMAEIVITGDPVGSGVQKIEPVTASPNGGIIPGGTQISLSTITGGAEIHYTTDGTVPNASSPKGSTITADFSAGPALTVKAIAVDPAGVMLPSDISTFTYTQAQLSMPIASPAAGAIPNDTSVTLSLNPADVGHGNILYTTDGSDPAIGTQYTVPFTVTPGTVVKAIVTGAGYLASPIATFSYPVKQESVAYNTDGENDTIAAWNYSATPVPANIAPATEGVNKTGSNLETYVKGVAKNYTFTSNGLATSGYVDAAGNAYWLLSTSTKGFTNINLSFRMRASATGPRDFKLQYSTDKQVWNDVNISQYNMNTKDWVDGTSIALPNALALNVDQSLFKADFKAVQSAVSNKDTLYLRLLLASNTAPGGNPIGSTGTNTANNFILSGGYILADNQVSPVIPSKTGPVALGEAITFTSNTSGAGFMVSDDGVNFVSASSYKFDTLPKTFYAKAVKDGMIDSRVKSFSYTQAKLNLVQASPSSGVVAAGDQVKLTVDSGAMIYYVLTKNVGDNQAILPEAVYTGQIPLLADMFPVRITAYARANGYLDSDRVTLDYTLKQSSGGERNYFGQLHSHTINSDGAGTLEEAFTYARDVAKLDFFAVTDHSNSFDTAPAGDKAGTYNLGAYNSNNQAWIHGQTAAVNSCTPTFTGIYGYEMTWSGGPGHINTFNTQGFVSRNNTELNNKTNDAGLKAYYALLKNTPESISQFNHPGTTFGNFSNFAYYDPIIDKQMKLVEVGNGEGEIGSGGYFPSYEQYTMALDKGWHVAPSNNQDNHKKGWGTSNTCRTVIWTNDMSASGLYQAIRDLRVYATEVSDLDITYKLNGFPLGSILGSVPEAAHFTAAIKNPTSGNIVKSVSIISNGGVEIGKIDYNTQNVDYDWTLNVPEPGYYYLRVVDLVNGQERYAVTAPVWLGKGESAGITDIKKSTDLPVTTEEMTLTTSLFNNETSPATLTAINYKLKDGTTLFTDMPNTTIAANGGTITHSMKYVPAVAGDTTVVVTATILLNGKSKDFTSEINYNVTDINKVTFIGIDGSHYNEYVAGNYKDNMGNFTKLAATSGVRTVTLNTSDDLIAACSNPKYKTLLLTAPTRRLQNVTFRYYSDAEIAAIAGFANNGGTVIICGWSDIYECPPAAPNAPTGLNNHMAWEQNKLLKAIGSSLRLGDDASVDEKLNPSPNQYRLYLPNTFNPDNPLTAGVVQAQTYSVYGGSTVYAVGMDGNPINTLPASVSPIISGLPTTWSEDRDKDGYGLPDPSIKLPRYGTSADAGRGNGTVLLNASEIVDHGAKSSLVIVSGGAFMSNFEIQVTIDNAGTLPYSNYTILSNIIKAAAPTVQITSIADAKNLPDGTDVVIEATATSEVNTQSINTDTNKGFFDCIYAQDATGGINLFPVSSGIKEGQKARFYGKIAHYQGEVELTVSRFTILDQSINKIVPATLSTNDTMLPVNTGLLVKTKGVVSNISKNADGTINQFTINDGSGPSVVFINGYITSGTALPFITDGAIVSVIGLASIGEVVNDSNMHPRIRVRDRSEIVNIELTGIAVTNQPVKTQYEVGQSLDLTGLVVTGTYNDETTAPLEITSSNVSGFDSTTVGSKTVTITVDGKTATFNVVIIDNIAPSITTNLSNDSSFERINTFTIINTAEDKDSGIDIVETTLDGVGISNNYVVNLEALAFGDHLMVVTARDKAGNVSSLEVKFTITATIKTLSSLLDKFYNQGLLKNKGLYNSLSTKLSMNTLVPLTNEVLAQKGKGLDEKTADIIIDYINWINLSKK